MIFILSDIIQILQYYTIFRDSKSTESYTMNGTCVHPGHDHSVPAQVQYTLWSSKNVFFSFWFNSYDNKNNLSGKQLTLQLSFFPANFLNQILNHIYRL